MFGFPREILEKSVRGGRGPEVVGLDLGGLMCNGGIFG